MLVTIAATLVIIYVLSKFYDSWRLKKRELNIREQAIDAAYAFLDIECWENINSNYHANGDSLTAINNLLREAEKLHEIALDNNLEKLYQQIYKKLMHGLPIDLPNNSSEAIAKKMIYDSVEKVLQETTIKALGDSPEKLQEYKNNIREYDILRTVKMLAKRKIILDKEFVF